jgi:hypothetical protein
LMLMLCLLVMSPAKAGKAAAEAARVVDVRRA